MITTVVNKNKEPFDVYIGRPSKWGNPFVIDKDGSRTEVIAKYRAWLLDRPDLLKDLRELKGKRLGCHCAPLPCHGDVLLEFADTMLDEKGNFIWQILSSAKRIMITGSRDWTDAKLIAQQLNGLYMAEGPENVTIVHGGAAGADILANHIAKAMGMETEIWRPQWNQNGQNNRRAGLERNIAMLKSGVDIVLAFHLNNSSGTAHAIREAGKLSIPVWKFERKGVMEPMKQKYMMLFRQGQAQAVSFHSDEQLKTHEFKNPVTQRLVRDFVAGDKRPGDFCQTGEFTLCYVTPSWASGTKHLAL